MGGGYARRLSPYHTLFLHDPHKEKVEILEKEGHGKASHDLSTIFPNADLVILAMKPQSFKEENIHWKPVKGQMVISLLAGVAIAEIKEQLPEHRIIRMMPNLAILYGEGQLGVVVDTPLNENEHRRLVEVAQPLGRLYWLEERMMDSFTALAGSGPAFVYAMIESMVEVGVKMGFTPKEAGEITQKMMESSLHLLEKSGKSTEELKRQIASPGGTTEAGLKEFLEKKVADGISATFLAAYYKAKNISN